MTRFGTLILLLSVLLMAGFFLALITGPIKIPPLQVIKTLFYSDSLQNSVLVSIRLPRIVAAALAGWALGLAGLCYQSLLKNPLASEYTLGIANGAAIGALTAALVGIKSGIWTPVFAFMGSTATMFVVFLVARSRFLFENYSLVLAGIILNAFGNALLSLILAVVSPNQLHSFLFWFLGSFAVVQWPTIFFAAPVIAVMTLLILMLSWEMNAISVNEELAQQVGISVIRTKSLLFLSSSLLTAVVVSFAGTIGFIGLVVPHLSRFLVGPDNRRLGLVVPFLGAILCIFSDLIARTLLAPAELPVGVVTAFLGVPVFLYFMTRRPA